MSEPKAPTAPNAKLLSDERIPTVTIDGQKWPIPKLAQRQLEIVMPIVSARFAALISGQRDNAILSTFTREAIHDFGTVAYWGLERGHPDLTREEFDNMPLDMLDLLEIVSVVTRQTGLMRTAKPGDKPLGEARAVSSPTGDN